MRLPQPNDFSSDTIKSTGALGLISVIIELIKLLGGYGVVSADIVDMTVKSQSSITIIMCFVIAFFRVNIKTKL